MKAVRDLCGCGSPLSCAISIGRRAVARDDLDPWMRAEPLGHRLGRPIREQGHGMVAFQINEHRAIGLAFPQSNTNRVNILEPLYDQETNFAHFFITSC